jgi:LemA protein
MKNSIKIVLGVIGIIFIFVLFLISGYNSIVNVDENVNKQWAQIENQLQRRYDLIPNLVETVKGYASHEEETLLKVVEARNQFKTASTPGEFANADANLTNAIKQLNVVVESYPDLKANQNFLDLQSQLEGTENRIAVARMDYNNAVSILNKKVKQFPSKIFANLANVEKREYFQINEKATENPQVKFD